MSQAPIPSYTLAQAVARINHLRPIVQQAMDDAFQKCPPGLTGLAQALILYDNQVFSAEQTVKSMRRVLGIEAIAEAYELGRLQAAFYQGHYHGAASEPKVGDHYADL